MMDLVQSWLIVFRRDMILLTCGTCLFLYVLLCRIARNLKLLKGNGSPPAYPTRVPFLGHLIPMAWDSPAFLGNVISSFKDIPVRLNLLVTDFYVISGAGSINYVLRESELHTRSYQSLAYQTIVNLPKGALILKLSDDSGINVSPHPASSIPSHLRIDYLHYSSVHKFLSGPGLKPFADRFTTNLLAQLSKRTDLGTDWTHLPDLFSLLRDEFLTASLQAMCGEYLLRSQPNFVQDYWRFHTALYTLAKGYPRWLKPRAYRQRDKCVQSLKAWHELIRPYFDDTTLEQQDWNPYYGAGLVKFRHTAWSKMDCMGPDAAASEDLGLIWAANGNSIPACFWMLAEIVRSPTLLAEVSKIVRNSRLQSEDGLAFDWSKLCGEPLLQSIYAETLRLRVASFILRSPERMDLKLGKWIIPRDATMLISGFNSQMDKETWEAKQHSRPVNEFWAERFLIPTKNAENQLTTGAIASNADSYSVKFSLEGRAANWLPYGGRQRMCPGRHFVKQEMICGMAIMISLFDIELEDESGNLPPCDMNGFGFGSLLPRDKMPVRIRRSFGA